MRLTMSPVSSPTTKGGVSQHATLGSSWAPTLTSLASSLEIGISMEGPCRQSLTMVRESAHGTCMTTFGISITALTKGHGLTMRWNTYMTSHSSLRSHVSAMHHSSSSYTRKRYERLRNVCGRPASSRTPACVCWRELTH